jgi:hypothetical protein
MRGEMGNGKKCKMNISKEKQYESRINLEKVGLPCTYKVD